MFIKKVNIQGFKSYRDAILSEEFSSKLNVIVGRNGSGKSNFFLAIQFVLSDDLGHLKLEEKQQILHEGFGASSQNAVVEIIFDNSDGRIPIEKEEVSLRRIIGSKDQYFLDKKLVTKQEILNLLESSGISHSNPYHIVKQGKINEMATCKDSERLKLLKEIAGANTYDERKQESEVILQDTLNKCEKIDELLKVIDNKLNTLEGEKGELDQFQRLIQSHREISDSLERKKSLRLKEKISQLNEEKSNLLRSLNELHSIYGSGEESILEQASKLDKLQKTMKEINHEMNDVKDELMSLQNNKSNLTMDLKDCEESFVTLTGNVPFDGQYYSVENFNKLQQEIAEKERKLKDAISRHLELTKMISTLQATFEVAQSRKSRLITAQAGNDGNKGKVILTQEEIILQLDTEIDVLKQKIDEKCNYKDSIGREQETLTAQLNISRNELENVERCVLQYKSELENEEKLMNSSKFQRDGLHSQRRELWRSENNCQQKINSLREDCQHTERVFRTMWPKAVSHGLNSLKIIQQNYSHLIKGSIYGTLLENFTCDERFFLCVDLVSGIRLSHVIVDSDVTASQILRELNNRNLPGELTFLPLNKLQVKSKPLPDTQEAVPLLKRLRFDKKLELAFQLCFDRVLICKNFDVACDLSKRYRLNCITLDGDQVSYHGVISGGYVDPNRVRIKSHHDMKLKQESLKEAEIEMAQIKSELTLLENEILQVENQFNKSLLLVTQVSEQLKQAISDRSNLSLKINVTEREIIKQKSLLEKTQGELGALDLKIKSLENEKHVDFKKSNKSELEKKLHDINKEISVVITKINELTAKADEAEKSKVDLELILNLNLYKKREDLTRSRGLIESDRSRSQVEFLRCQIENYDRSIDTLSQKLNELTENRKKCDADSEKINVSLLEIESNASENKNKMQRLNEEIVQLTSRIDTLMRKQNSSNSVSVNDSSQLKETLNNSIVTSTYSSLSVRELMDRLSVINEDLKKFESVNRKAFDQFVEFSEQKQNLLRRQTELRKSHEAITSMMQVLEERKNEAIIFTFRQVSKYFSEIFQQMVPHGHASLVMKRSVDQSEDSTVQNIREGSVEAFSGIAIKACFSENSNETYSINQLSGGQKTLVALTLIFAIQRCDPAPFYLFDEIDQALDPAYRTSVAKAISILSEKAQFIVTTFRPELLAHSDKFFGVQYRNRVSKLVPIDRSQAEQFVSTSNTVEVKENLSQNSD